MSDGENSPRYLRVVSVTDPQCRYPSQYGRPAFEDRPDASFGRFLKVQEDEFEREHDSCSSARWSSCSDARFGRVSECGHRNSSVSFKLHYENKPFDDRESARSSSTGSLCTHGNSQIDEEDIWDVWDGERSINGSSVRPTLTLLGFRTSFLDAPDTDTFNCLLEESLFPTVDARRDLRSPSFKWMEGTAGAVEMTMDGGPSHKQSVTFADPLAVDEPTLTMEDNVRENALQESFRSVGIPKVEISAETIEMLDDINATIKSVTSQLSSPSQESRMIDDIYNGVLDTHDAARTSRRDSSSSAADVDECRELVGALMNSESQPSYDSRTVRVTHMDPRVTHMDPRVTHMDPRVTHMDARVTFMEPRVTRMDPRVTLMEPRVSQSVLNDSSASTESPKSKTLDETVHRSSVENLFDQMNWDNVLEQVVTELEKNLDDSAPFINQLRNSFHRVISRNSARASEISESSDDEEDQGGGKQARMSETLREACARAHKEVGSNDDDEERGEIEAGAAKGNMRALARNNAKTKGQGMSRDLSAAATLLLEQITAAVRSTLALEGKRRGSMPGCEFYKPLKDWATVDVCCWLDTISHFSGQEVQTIVRENDITGPVLLSLTVDELKELGLRSFGLRKQLKLSCKRLVEQLTQSTGLTSSELANITRDAAPVAPVPKQTQMTFMKKVMHSVAYETKTTQMTRAGPGHRPLVSCGPLPQVRLVVKKERGLSPPKSLQIPQPSCNRGASPACSSPRPCLSLPTLRAPSLRPTTPSSSREVQHPSISPRRTPAPPRFLNAPSITASVSSPTLTPRSIPFSPSQRSPAKNAPGSDSTLVPQKTFRTASSSDALLTSTTTSRAARHDNPMPNASMHTSLLQTQHLCAPKMTRTLSPVPVWVSSQSSATEGHSYSVSAGNVQVPVGRSSAETSYRAQRLRAGVTTRTAPVSGRSFPITPARVFSTNDLKGQASSSSLFAP